MNPSVASRPRFTAEALSPAGACSPGTLVSFQENLASAVDAVAREVCPAARRTVGAADAEVRRDAVAASPASQEGAAYLSDRRDDHLLADRDHKRLIAADHLRGTDPHDERADAVALVVGVAEDGWLRRASQLAQYRTWDLSIVTDEDVDG